MAQPQTIIGELTTITQDLGSRPPSTEPTTPKHRKVSKSLLRGSQTKTFRGFGVLGCVAGQGDPTQHKTYKRDEVPLLWEYNRNRAWGTDLEGSKQIHEANDHNQGAGPRRNLIRFWERWGPLVTRHIWVLERMRVCQCLLFGPTPWTTG